MSFKNKVVIVTGASSGIGAASAVLYAKHGAKLVINGRNEEKLRKTAALCQEQGIQTEDVLLVLGDLTNEEVCNTLVDKTIEKFGSLDVLVNNAGAMVHGKIDTCTIQNVDSMFGLHVRSVFMIIKRALPHLRRSKGNIVNISSCNADVPMASMLAVSISKAAETQLTKCLAQDVGPSGVRVNSIEPGLIDTDILTNPGGFIEGHPELQAEFLEGCGKCHALDRCGTSNEVAEAILFVTSDAASFITGAQIVVDGGLEGKNAF